MTARKTLLGFTWIVMVCSIGFAQTPTPLPGTPLALTCADFTFLPGLSGVEILTNWLYLDRACILLENTTGGAIEIATCQGYFSETSNPAILQIRIWEILNEQFLPDLPAAAVQVSETYGFSVDPVPGNPQVALVTFDLENYQGGVVSMPVINPGKKFVVDIINLLDEGGSGLPGMKITAEQTGECPPSYWSDGTNLFGNYQTGTTTWNFKEDIGNSTNVYLGVTYYDNANPRTPSMGTLGLIGVLIGISVAISRRRK